MESSWGRLRKQEKNGESWKRCFEMEKETYVQRSIRIWDSVESLAHARKNGVYMARDFRTPEKDIRKTDKGVGKMIKDLLKRMEE